ncbi:hypothetical protein LEAN103870_04430 [Legionella anisa]|uniref:Uncharacterized protein n=1 Tax=Legionella anisa TaxID=28082 RepID=A0AAX0WY05_9GAMM|nr:hypothetical protein [Legionella anisa]AWN72896.1 hypothetical protein DLD14_03040 [Legionella anisa]KTC70651.1 hypothetical protein Lani_2198 [Legionella anisa]MCW8423706.1 hypothetical protein [Legionella anisa]MCW8447226.1 hypothetical protein [Legionella anisa]PNL63351.1 hypothetical protein A6J39_020325 [Legionella anisa]
MALSKTFKDLIAAGEGHYQENFRNLRDDVKIAIYQKLLFKAGETAEGSDERKALASLNDPGFQNSLSQEVRDGIKIEQQRYATAKANAIYQDYLREITLERVRSKVTLLDKEGHIVLTAQEQEEVKKKYEGLEFNEHGQLTSGNLPAEEQSKILKKRDDLLFDPQARLIYELTLSEKEQEKVLKKIEAALNMPNVDDRQGIEIKAGLKKVLGGRTPTDTTLCSIDLSGQVNGEGTDVHKRLRDKFVKKYGGQPLLSHQRASMVASFEETYAHMNLMARTFERRSITYGEKKETISHDAWQNIRHNAALKVQDEVAKAYKEAVKKSSDPNGKVDVNKLNKNLAKERVKLAESAKKALIEGVVAHLKERVALSLEFDEEGKLTKEEQKDLLKKHQDLKFDDEGNLTSGSLTKAEQEALIKKRTRETVLGYMQKLSGELNKHVFTAETATGYDYFYTSNYLQQGMLISGTKHTAHDKPSFIPGLQAEDQAAFRRVTYTYRDENGVLHPTSAVSARIPSPALVFHPTMNAQKIREDLVKKFGFLHEQMRDMRGGKDGPVVENLFTSFHSEAFETIGDNNNRQRASALYMIQAMHEFNAQGHVRVQELKKKEEYNLGDRALLKKLEEELEEHKGKKPKDEEVVEYTQRLVELQDTVKDIKQYLNKNFLYVQNIGTNRHTRDLGYRDDRSFVTGSVELDDITLSAEMAMLHTLEENSAYLSEEVKEKITAINARVLEQYGTFLDDKQRPKYFAQSIAGDTLIKEIRAFKKELESGLSQQEDVDDLPSLASNALARMIATNQHWDVRYGQLSQALSMYIEWASTGGCKSGNERNQDVMLRFALLKSIHERVEHNDGKLDKLQEHEKAIYAQMKAYAKGETADPDALRAAIAVSVSKCNMHGGAAAISREDQGGAAKVSSFSFIQDIKSSFLRWSARIALGLVALATFPLLAIPPVRKFYVNQLIDTNNAADREMNLDATGASKTQAHKGQDKRTREVVLEVLKEDELFNKKKGGTELTSTEKDGFKKAKGKSHEGYEFQFEKEVAKVKVVEPEFNDGPKTLVDRLGVKEIPKQREVSPRLQIDLVSEHNEGLGVIPTKKGESEQTEPYTPTSF